jgi:hypothetical protein
MFYELVSEHEGESRRRFVYILRRKPTTAVIRGIHEYNPDEALEALLEARKPDPVGRKQQGSCQQKHARPVSYGTHTPVRSVGVKTDDP